MAEEEFEIDVYGDAEGGQDQGHDDQGQDQNQGAEGYSQRDEHHEEHNDEIQGDDQNGSANDYGDHNGDHGMDGQHDDRPAPQQGVKRKQDTDDRPIDPGATNALLVSEMQWWVTEDEIRGWIRSASCEDELKDITFSEHKVNGKSKG